MLLFQHICMNAMDCRTRTMHTYENRQNNHQVNQFLILDSMPNAIELLLMGLIQIMVLNQFFNIYTSNHNIIAINDIIIMIMNNGMNTKFSTTPPACIFRNLISYQNLPCIFNGNNKGTPAVVQQSATS